jgi:hypothetical protein
MHQDLTNTSGQPGARGTFWNWLGCAVVDGRQGWRCGWWRAHELLEKAHMEDVVEASAGRKLEAVGDVVDDGHDAVWPIESGCNLPLVTVWREAGARCRRRSQTQSPTL